MMPRLRPTIFLFGSMPWVVVGTLAGCLDALDVHYGGGRGGGPPVVVTDQAGEVVVQFGEDAFLAPGGEVGVDGLVGRQVVGQVSPGDAGAIDVEDGVEDLAQVAGGGAAADSGVGAGLSPGGQSGCDQGPAGIGQVGRVGATLRGPARSSESIYESAALATSVD